jgi:glycine/D-amino acid oxidase-like deaminating enzyme
VTNIHRRAALQGIATLAAIGIARIGRANGKGRRIGVIGGGIVGASIAMHLARAGASVTVLERTSPAAGATAKSFAWINPWTLDPHYQQLRLRSIAAYRRLDAELRLGIVWGGYIDWAADAAEAKDVNALAATMAAGPDAVRVIDAAGLKRISPCIEPGQVAAAFYSGVDGHLDPVYATRRFLAHAQTHGARILYPCEVSAMAAVGARVQRLVTTQGAIEVDHVVVAAGVDTPRLLAMLGYNLQLRHAPGILAHSMPVPLVTQMVYDGPRDLEFKQMADGRLVGNDAELPPDIPAHAEILRQATDFPSAALRDMHGTRILGKISKYMPTASQARLDYLTLGLRPMPMDGFPVVGGLPALANVHVAVTHSGVTLAPILGQLVRDEILQGPASDMLAPYRPGRMLGASQRTFWCATKGASIC